MESTIWVALITGGFGLASAVIVNRRMSRRLGLVHDQVANTHDTNLRDDIDRVLDALGDVRNDIALLRTEVSHDRRERIELGWQVDRIAAQHRAE